MPQLDVYHNPDKSSLARIPYVVVLQFDLLDSLEHFVVAPLRIKQDDSVIPMLRLNPLTMIDGQEYHVRVQDIATVPRRMLKSPVANLSTQRDEIIAALDLLFTGF